MASNAPDRTQRQQCYTVRDAYYKCLDQAGVVAPGTEGSRCSKELEAFRSTCAASWIEHFNKRRVFEAQRAAVLAADEARAKAKA